MLLILLVTVLVKEQVKRSAVIVNHKKKKKKCGSKLDKLLNPVEEKPPVPSSSECSSESETDAPKEELSGITNQISVEENTPEVIEIPENSEPVAKVEQHVLSQCVEPKEQKPRKPSAYVRSYFN